MIYHYIGVILVLVMFTIKVFKVSVPAYVMCASRSQSTTFTDRLKRRIEEKQRKLVEDSIEHKHRIALETSKLGRPLSLRESMHIAMVIKRERMERDYNNTKSSEGNNTGFLPKDWIKAWVAALFSYLCMRIFLSNRHTSPFGYVPFYLADNESRARYLLFQLIFSATEREFLIKQYLNQRTLHPFVSFWDYLNAQRPGWTDCNKPINTNQGYNNSVIPLLSGTFSILANWQMHSLINRLEYSLKNHTSAYASKNDIIVDVTEKHLGPTRLIAIQSMNQSLSVPLQTTLNTFTMLNQGMNNQGMNNQGMNNQGMYNQGMNNQGMNNQGMNNQGMNNQGMYNQGMINQGMNNQGMNNQGMNNQGMNNQGMINQGMNNQGMNNQGMMNQGMTFNENSIDINDPLLSKHSTKPVF